MGERTDQIERHIEETRGSLGRNLSELQERVKSGMNWRHQFQRHPITMVGAAFGGALMLSMMIRKNGSRRRGPSEWGGGYQERSTEASYPRATPRPSRAITYQRRRASEMWDNVKGALIGVSAANVQRFLENLIPGFREEYQKTEQQKRAGMNTPEMPLTSSGGGVGL